MVWHTLRCAELRIDFLTMVWYTFSVGVTHHLLQGVNVMSRGNPIIKVRVRHSTFARIHAYLQKRADNPLVELWDMSEFLRNAIVEKLDHLERSSRKRTKRPKAAEASPVVQEEQSRNLAELGRVVNPSPEVL
jgi:hypothetical protein